MGKSPSTLMHLRPGFGLQNLLVFCLLCFGFGFVSDRVSLWPGLNTILLPQPLQVIVVQLCAAVPGSCSDLSNVRVDHMAET